MSEQEVSPAPWSPWLPRLPAPAAPLDGERRVDVAVVGAGYTGLGAALALRAEGLSVAVIEGAVAGYGASGRNAGHLTPTIGKDLPTLLRMFGRERTRRLVGLAETAVRHVEDTIRRHAIDCDYHAGGNVMAAVHDAQRRRLERAAGVATQLGVHARFLDPAEMSRRQIPDAFKCGLLEEVGGILHPGRYLLGLRRAAVQAGAELYEHTPLSRIDEGPRPLLHTPRGRIRADRVVLATNAYTPAIGYLRHLPLPVSVSLFWTAPLTEEQRRLLPWPGREGIYTAHEILESYRLTADNRILGGSKFVRYGFGGRILPDEDGPTFAALERLFRERFPEVNVPIERFWSGPIALTLDFLPALGCTGRYRNLFYGIGYNGHGVALASYAGQALTDWITGRDTPARVLIERRSWPLPPEPLCWGLTHGLLRLLGAFDARVDRQARAQGRTRSADPACRS